MKALKKAFPWIVGIALLLFLGHMFMSGTMAKQDSVGSPNTSDM